MAKEQTKKSHVFGSATAVVYTDTMEMQNEVNVMRKPAKCKNKHHSHADFENFLPRFELVLLIWARSVSWDGSNPNFESNYRV